MKILYELAGTDENIRFSPYCWRVRMALAHKELEVESCPSILLKKKQLVFLDRGEYRF